MKTLNFALGIAAFSLAAAVGNVKRTVSQQMQDCFKLRGQLMERPAVSKLYDCWRAHGCLIKDQKQS